MLDLIVLALIQFATLTGTPTNSIDSTQSTPSTTIGSTGWDHDVTGTSTPSTTIGSTGWDHDVTGTPAPNPTIGSTGWDHD